MYGTQTAKKYIDITIGYMLHFFTAILTLAGRFQRGTKRGKTKMNFSKRLMTSVFASVMGFNIAFVSVATVCLTLPTGAGAAEDDMEEVIVTARKRDESLQEVPLAVTAFTAEDIEAQGLTDARDLADAVAGLEISSDFGRRGDRPSIRGIANIQPATDQPVSGFLDGVFLSGQALISSGLNIIERVEVVKGPQSALYGRATFAGAVNFITKDPTDEFEADLKLNLAQHGQEDIAASFSGPIIPGTLGFLVAARSYDFDGDYDIGATPEYNRLASKVVPGGFNPDFFLGVRSGPRVVESRNNLTGDAGEESSKNFFGKLSFTPTERIGVDISYAYEEIDDGTPRIALNHLDNNNFNPGTTIRRASTEYGPDAPPFLRNSVGGDRPGYYLHGDVPTPDVVSAACSQFTQVGGCGIRRDSHRVSGIFNLEINDHHAVKYIASYYHEDQVSALDQSYTGLEFAFGAGGPFRWGTYDDNKFESMSHELRLFSTYDGPLGLHAYDGPLNWSLGFYYYDDRNMRNDFGRPYTAGKPLVFEFEDESKTIAAFGSLGYEFVRDLTASVELRWFEEDIERTDADRSSVRVIQGPNVTRSTDFDDITMRYTLDYQLTDDILVYGLYSQGFKRGGFNSLDASRANASLSRFKPETIDNYEIGLKTQWPGYGLTLNLSAYRMDWDDLQLSQAVETAGNPITAIANVGDARINGFEADLKWQPDDYWTLVYSVALVDPEFKKGCERIQAQFSNNPCPAGSLSAGTGPGANIAGQTVPRISRLEYNMSAAYNSGKIWHGHGFFGRVDAAFKSGRYAQVQNLASTGDSFKVNLRTGITGDHYTVTFFADNLTDEDTPVNLLRYIDLAASSSSTNRNVAASLPAKRQFGLILEYNF